LRMLVGIVLPSVALSLASRPPVVLVNGLTGSILRGKLEGVKPEHAWCKTKKDWHRMWLNVAEILPLEKDCLLHNLELQYNVTTKTYANTTGVEVDGGVDFGGVGGLSILDPGLFVLKGLTGYYNTLIEKLEAAKYKVGVDLHGAPYDWRLAGDGHTLPGQYYSKLRSLIEATVVRNNGTAAFLIGHSLGCPTTLYFLSLQSTAWLSKHVAGFIALAGVWGGSTKMVLSIVSGDNFGAPVPDDYLRRVQRSAASGAWMLPEPATFDPALPIVRTTSRNYTSADMLALFADLGLSQTAAIYNKLHDDKVALDQLPRPQVPTTVIWGHGVKTSEAYVYDKPLAPGFVGAPAHMEYGDGDGVVNLVSSLEPLRRWPKAGPPVTFHNFSGLAHFDAVKDDNVRQLIFQVLGV